MPFGGEGRAPSQSAERALQKIISMDQRIFFAEEYSCLQKNQPIPRNSRLIQFNPVLEDGIIKMQGRVSKNLIILPDKSHLTRLIIRDAHISNLHAGPNQTLAHLRQKYWIIKGMTAVKAETKSCMTVSYTHLTLPTILLV